MLIVINNGGTTMWEFIGSVLLVANILAMALLKRHIESFVDKRLKAFAIQAEWDQKVREQASKVAEYLSLALVPDAKKDHKDFARLNQLGWELAMFLPSDTYKAVVASLLNPPLTFDAVLEVRNYLVGDKLGILTSNDLAVHAPGIGKGARKS